MIGIPPRSGQPVTVDQSDGGAALVPVARQYGMPLPAVYGTWKVTGKLFWLGNPVNVSDATVRDTGVTPPSWKLGPGRVGAALVGLCEGPIASVARVWRGSDSLPDIRMLSRPIETSGALITTLVGDGTEAAWAHFGTLTARSESYSVRTGTTVFQVPNPTAVTADLGAGYLLAVGRATPMTLVGASPVTGQYTYSAGTYGFSAADNNRTKIVTISRNLSDLPAWQHPTAYVNTAQIRFEALVLPDEGLPNYDFEVVGLSATIADPRGAAVTYALDAHPADVLLDLLTHARRGLGWATSQVEVDLGPDGATASGYRTWCTAMGFAVSRAITDRVATSQLVEDLLAATHARCVWSEGRLKVLPLGELAVGAYTPAAIVANIGEDDLVVSRGSDPVSAQRVLPSETFTACPVSFGDRNSNYDTVTVETILTDPFTLGSAAYTGYEQPAELRRADARDMPWVSRPDHAGKLSWLLGMRSLYCRNTYRFTLGPRWARLEPGDLLALTDPVLGLAGERVRITSIEERDSGELELYCEEAPFSVATIPALSVQTNDGLSSVTPPPVQTLPGGRIDDGTVDTPQIATPTWTFVGGWLGAPPKVSATNCYRSRDAVGRVTWKGTMGPTASYTVGYLVDSMPAKWRPSTSLLFRVYTEGASPTTAEMRVAANGDITFVGGTLGVEYSMSSVSWLAEA